MNRDWKGRWRPKPGSILLDGAIVDHRGQPQGRAVILIEHRRQYAAESYGWQATGRVHVLPMGEQLVEVAR